MPAKSVIFMDLVKFDGQRRRLLNAGEFAQMAGRAGRRGKDPQGHVYVMLHSSEILDQPVEYILEDLYSSSAPQVSSCFRLRWSSLLHLISTGPAHLYSMLTNSLLSFADPLAAEELKDEAERKIRALQAMNFVDSSCSALPKGTLACHFFVPDDGLLVSEIVLALHGFIGLSAAQIFAVCACFVAEGRHPDNWKRYVSDAKVKESIATCKSVAQQMACRLHTFSLPCFERCDQLTCGFCDGAAFAAARVNPSFAETAYRWARGDDFTEAVLQSRVPVGGEGIVVRTLRRLDEFMREVTFVLRHDLGAIQVADSIREARLQARRGVVAMQSVYLGEQDDVAGEELEPEPPFPQQLLPLGPGWLDPLDIMFSQGHCAAKFRRPIETGTSTAASILELAQALAHGDLDISQFSLEVYWFRHRFYSLGNRRLAAFRLWRLLVGTPLSVPVVVVDKSRAVKRHWLSKFTTGFTGGRKIRVTHTGDYIGMSREQSTYGQSLWCA
ncbi:mtr-4 [Symbiodinium necroappetens]|uniref:Mtr-4 protein n=1 Tax=Symbiodinium necroappetens TaxID=1628268 RepID=A0A813ALD4_9DINO|nr:mtr-4 [Symbiodinium necroappetens]